MPFLPSFSWFSKRNFFKNFRNRLIDGFIFDEKILIGCPTLLHRARALTARVTLNLKAKFDVTIFSIMWVLQVESRVTLAFVILSPMVPLPQHSHNQSDTSLTRFGFTIEKMNEILQIFEKILRRSRRLAKTIIADNFFVSCNSDFLKIWIQ